MMFPKSVYFTDQGIRRTSSLFIELSTRPQFAVFTLDRTGEDRREGYVNIRQLYMDACVSDPTEATFAEAVFPSYSYWEVLAEGCLKDEVEEWRKAAEVKRKSLMFKAMVKEVEENGKSSFSAAKFLIEEPWKNKRDKKVREEAKETTNKAASQHKSDITRLREQGLIN